MTNTVISVEHLSKAYSLGQIGTGTLTYYMKLWWAKLRGKPNSLLRIGETDHGNRDGETIWALKDVSFTVEQGEVLGITNKSLRALGQGANAFRLTKQVVDQDIYSYTRNPMSLGYYLFALSIGLVSGSTLFTLAILLGLIPAHLFFPKYLEELELELRLGELYKEYKQKTSFLIPKFSAK